MTQAVFHGTEEEALALLQAIDRNCVCNRPLGILVGDPCLTHMMLVDQQRQLDGLLFARRNVDKLLVEEFTP